MKHKSKLLINFIFLLAILLFGVYAVKSNSTSEARQKCTKELKTISASGTLNTIRRGGIGGFVDNEVYDLKNVPLKIGGQEMTVPTIKVLTDKLSFLTNYDGHLGQDVLIYFDKILMICICRLMSKGKW